MFCPKCGTQNPDEGKFCRSCGTDLGNVSKALSTPISAPVVDRKGRPISWDSAVSRFFMGSAFLLISIILGATGKASSWWFWLLIPAFSMLGAGVAQWMRLKHAGIGPDASAGPRHTGFEERSLDSGRQQHANVLPPQQTDFVPAPESRYKTGDLVPPSVTEGTTRHLDNSEGKTMTPPTKE